MQKITVRLKFFPNKVNKVCSVWKKLESRRLFFDPTKQSIRHAEYHQSLKKQLDI